MIDLITVDLSKFGYRELTQAIELLKAYNKEKCDFLGEGLTLNLNMDSGNGFLSDEDYNVGKRTF